jgi:hypothetical protein
VISDDDVTLILKALFDIRKDLSRIVEILEGDDDEPEGSEEEDS